MNALIKTFGSSVTMTMSSLEISELTGKRHGDVIRDIRVMLDALQGDDAVLRHVLEEKDARGYTTAFHLNRELTDTLLTGYSIPLRRKVIARWHELEAKQAKPAELSRMEILRIAMESEEARLQAEAERDFAIATKAEIGTRREATAMNTASQAIKKAQQLEIELDKSKEYSTVKRMGMLYHGMNFNWRLLKSTSTEMGVPPIDVFDQNYGTVKSNHHSVWREAYAVSIMQEDAA